MLSPAPILGSATRNAYRNRGFRENGLNARHSEVESETCGALGRVCKLNLLLLKEKRRQSAEANRRRSNV